MIINLLRGLGYETVDKEYYNHVHEWNAWYKGKVEDFHSYKVYNGTKLVSMEKYTLNMAKTICEDWSNYLFSRDTKITTKNERTDDILSKFMDNVKFYDNISDIIEIAFATGTGAVTLFKSNHGVELNYIKNTHMIFPLSWDNGEVVDVAFAGYKTIDGKKLLYLNIHEKRNNKWHIKNLFYELDRSKNIGKEVVVNGVLREYISDIKLFAIFKPAILNNIDVNNPLGASVFANAIDALKGLDNVYDSYVNEFVLGKKRIMVSADAVKVQYVTSVVDGKSVEKTIPVFDTNDTTFYMLPTNAMGDTVIKEIDMTLRVTEHKEAIQDMLNVLSVKVGFGTKHYNFVNGTITATEVKASTDALYNAMMKHITGLDYFLKTILNGAMALMGMDAEVVIEYDDSVIRDTNQDLVNNLQLLQNNVIGRADVLAWWKGIDREEAVKLLQEIDKDRLYMTE